MELEKFPGRLALQQRVLPAYRAPFFNLLAEACMGGLSVFAGLPMPAESITTIDHLEKAHYVKVHNRNLFTPSSPLYQCWQDGILGWLEDWQPDALIVEANPRYLSTARAVQWMHKRKRPVIGWGLGAPALSGPLGVWRSRLRQSFLKPLDAIIAYSQQGALEYTALGFPAERVVVARNAVAPRPKNPFIERPTKYNVRPGVLFVGRLQTRKRVDNLLHACAAMPEDLQPRLWIVGDGPARAEYEKIAQKIYPQAEFTGALQGAELEAYFTAADVFVLPGTGGLAVQQAMCYSLPVVVAEADGTQNDLVRKENGWLIPPDDLNALIAVLQIALSDPARLRSMGAASYRIVSQEVNLEEMVKIFVQTIRQVTKVG